MKQYRFLQFFSLVSVFLLAASSVFAQPGEGRRDGNFPDFSYTASPTRIANLDLAQQIAAMPEFATFFDALTARIDEEYVKASNQPNFPAPVADLILDKVREAKGKTEISSKDVIELFFSQVELVQFEAFLKKAYDAGDFGPMAKVKGGEYARLTIVTKFSPAELAGLLDFIKPFVTVEMIKAEEDDFLVSAFDPNKDEGKVFLGGKKIESLGNYAVVFSMSRELVEQKLNMLQSERARNFVFGENAPAKSFRFNRGVFEIAKAEIQKKIDAGEDKEKDALRIVEQINNFSVVTRDFDGKTGTQLRLAMNSEDAASDLKDMADGGKALLRFLSGSENVDADARKLINLLLNTEIERDGQNLTATINWSSDEFVQLIKEGLKKATVKVEE